MQLQHLGFEGDCAGSAVIAMELFTSGDYGLILMDLQMPGLNGFDATRCIRQFEVENKRARIPIIGVSAFPDDEGCLASGMDDFLPKPVKLDQLRAILKAYLMGQSPG